LAFPIAAMTRDVGVSDLAFASQAHPWSPHVGTHFSYAASVGLGLVWLAANC